MKTEAIDLLRAISLGWVTEPERVAAEFLRRHEGIDLTTEEGREKFLSAAEAMRDSGYDVEVVR